MGLFRKSSAWANTQADLDKSCGRYDGNKKRDFVSRGTSFNTSFNTNFNTTTGDGSGSISTANSSFYSNGGGGTDAHARNKMLERELRRRDETISRLRRTMEAGEKAQSERVALLELQLERLIELPSREYQGKVGAIKSGAVRGADLSSRGDPLEVPALEELLTRVIAEKDRLGFENKNLKSLLTLRNDDCHRSSTNGNMPPSISQLDRMMDEEYEMACQTQLRDPPVDPDDLKENDTSRDQVKSRIRVESKSKSKSKSKTCVDPPAKMTKGLDSVHYKMSFRDGCPGGDPSHLKYIGAYKPMCPNDSDRELSWILRAHFSAAWVMAHENGGICKDESVDFGFSTSPFARHLADQCKCLSDEEEVIRWCVENVKVEIGKVQKNRTEVAEEIRLRPSKKEKKKRRSKSRFNEKKVGSGDEC